MAYVGDFIVEDGVMTRYIGVGGDIAIPDCVKEIGESSFINCIAVSGVEIPEGVELIRYAAFSWRTGILKVTFPRSLRVIEEGAFEGCTGLTKVELPEGVSHIHTAAFHGCQNIEYIRIPSSLQQYEGFLEENSSTAIVAPDIDFDSIPEMHKINAAQGFVYFAGEASEKVRKQYMDYIMLHKKTFCDRALHSKALLRFLMEEEIIQPQELEQMLAWAIEKKDFELTASMLDYQGKIMTADKLKQRIQQQEEELSAELWEF